MVLASNHVQKLLPFLMLKNVQEVQQVVKWVKHSDKMKRRYRIQLCQKYHQASVICFVSAQICDEYN